MIGFLISVLIVLLVLVVVWYIVRLAASSFGLPSEVVSIIGLILALIFLLWLLSSVGTFGPHWRLYP